MKKVLAIAVVGLSIAAGWAAWKPLGLGIAAFWCLLLFAQFDKGKRGEES